MARPSLDETMIEIAQVLAKRGTCMKKKVGCIIIDKLGNIISTGYNGQPRNVQHCDPINPCPAHFDGNLSCSAIHAEMNALVRCSNPDNIHVVYVTEQPCAKCDMLIKNTSCEYIVYPGEDENIVEFL